MRRKARVAAAAAVLISAALGGCARSGSGAASRSRPARSAAPRTAYPVQARYAAAGPYATTTGVVTDKSGRVRYDLYYPRSYAALGFSSPIVTWGNGTGGKPANYSVLLTHFASYGFTVIASSLPDTGSGVQIAAAARYLVAQDRARASVFDGHLDVHEVAAVGHSQGAGGATRAAVNNPRLITTLMTFSLPETRWVGSNPDCPVARDCMYYPARLTQPAFFISTRGTLDSFIASPAAECAYFESVQGHAALGIIADSGGQPADHLTPEDIRNGGDPAGLLGYATAWLEYHLLGRRFAAAAFADPHPELATNPNWPGSAVK